MGDQRRNEVLESMKKKCKHEYRFLEKITAISKERVKHASDIIFTDVGGKFYCIKCLNIKLKKY